MKRVSIALLLALGLIAWSAAAATVESIAADRAVLSLIHTWNAAPMQPLSEEAAHAPARPLYDASGSRLLAYVYDIVPQGYVVVASDTQLPPIIAYSPTSAFPWEDSAANVLLPMLRSDLSLRFDALEQGLIPQEQRTMRQQEWEALAAPAGVEPTAATGDGMVGPLIEAPTWAQRAPWNEFCPIDPATQARSATGCVATALAQILAYWDYPASVRFSENDNYTTGMRSIRIDAPNASIDLIDYGSVDFYNPDDETMARLSYAAGVSVRMDYSSRGSGAYAIDLAVALAGAPAPVSRAVHPGVWQYESADIRTYSLPQWGAPFYQTSSEFFDTMRSDLYEERPAILCVTTGLPNGGHTLIVDGYEPLSDRFHLNLGWGGYSDGWYALPTDMPPGYSIIEYGVFNISPPPKPEEPEEPAVQVAGGGDAVEASDELFYAGPNPFSDEVFFAYRGATSPSTLYARVFDLRGRLVWEEEAPGAMRIRWTGVDMQGDPLANGTYLYVVLAIRGEHIQKGRGTVTLTR